MQGSIITVDVADLENVQANLLSVKALVELIIGDANDSMSLYKRNKIVSDAFGSISTALSGVHTLIGDIIDYSTASVDKAFQTAMQRR